MARTFQTTYSPDTCACEFVYEEDEFAANPKALVKVVRKCKFHEGYSGVEFLNEVIRDNREQNKILSIEERLARKLSSKP